MPFVPSFSPARIAVLASFSIALACSAPTVSPEPRSTLGEDTDSTTKGAPLSDPTTGFRDAVSGRVPVASTPGDESDGGNVVAPIPLPYRGVNLAGGEFGTALPGSEGIDYTWPTAPEVDYFVSKGMNTFRIGFKWERLQPTAGGELASGYVAKLDALVAHATSKGASVILDPHNFARYYGIPVGSSTVPASVFADLWRRLALRYADNPRVIFNLVNEPHTMPTEQWVGAANAAIQAIRAAGASNLIHVPGNAWTGAHSWNASYYGTPNAQAMLDIVDPSDRIVFEVHQYLDTDSSGSSDQCVSATIGSERLAPFVAWLRANGKKGFVGEFAGGNNSVCNAAVKDMLAAMMDASDVLVGWLWWAAGRAWRNYPFSLHPSGDQDQPQMTLLLPYLTATKDAL
jgi:endoglucanase